MENTAPPTHRIRAALLWSLKAVAGVLFIPLSIPIAIGLGIYATIEWYRVRHTLTLERGLTRFLSSHATWAMGPLLLPYSLVVMVVSPIEKSRHGQLGTVGKLLLATLCAAVLAGVPFVASDYRMFQLAQAAIYCVIVLGLNILTGYTGQVSLGHGAFALTGAYACGMLLMGVEGVEPVHPVLAVLGGGVISAVLGLAIGLPSLRLSGPYLGLVTLALSVSMPIIIRSRYLGDLTGGATGLSVSAPEPPAWTERFFSPEQWSYYTALVPSLLLVWIGWGLLQGRVGRAFKALRDSEIGAQMVGISLTRYKLVAFAVSAFYAGVGGGLLALSLGFVSPDTFTLLDSINFLTATVVGGLASVLGSVLGGLFLAFQQDVNSWLSGLIPHGEDLRWAIYGSIVIGIVLYAPGGLASKLYKKI